jgi:superfamily I DNA/RNA helicase
MNKLWWVKPSDLDDDQKKVLGLPLSGRHLVLGPPGSGKSNLLVLRAKYVQQSRHQNFRIVAFTQTLVRFLRASGAVPEQKIITATKFFDDQLYDLEARRIKEDDMDKRRGLVAQALLDHLHNNNKRGLIHTLLVDEMQDYTKQELAVFSTIAEHLFLVGDIRQQIQTSDTTHKDLDAMKSDFNVVELEFHYRIGRNICALADRIAKPAKGHKAISDGCQYNEIKNPSKVERLTASLDEQAEEIVERIKNQLDAFPGEFIGVLCPKGPVLETVADKLVEELGDLVCVQRSGDYHDFDLDKPVIVSTIHSGKGLEYRCVHIPSADSLKRMPHSRELIYTAVTRAKTSVTIYNEEDLNDFLEDALKGDEPPPPPPTFDSLFS